MARPRGPRRAAARGQRCTYRGDSPASWWPETAWPAASGRAASAGLAIRTGTALPQTARPRFRPRATRRSSYRPEDDARRRPLNLPEDGCPKSSYIFTGPTSAPVPVSSMLRARSGSRGVQRQRLARVRAPRSRGPLNATDSEPIPVRSMVTWTVEVEALGVPRAAHTRASPAACTARSATSRPAPTSACREAEPRRSRTYGIRLRIGGRGPLARGPGSRATARGGRATAGASSNAHSRSCRRGTGRERSRVCLPACWTSPGGR